MCGICGWVTKKPIQENQVASVLAMNAAMIHRGPDGMGQYRSSHLTMAMRRLSIIDLTTGQQPLYNEDKSLALIANGEIYNYIELREYLIAKGHRFKTGSDCETILHLYEARGLDCVQSLRGMFAFALWDERNQRLLLARDRMGEKPLYLSELEDGLIFASEIKAMLCSDQVPFELDPLSVDQYFHFGYVPEPATPLKRVNKLNAAHMIVIDVNPWRVREIPYWKLTDAPPLNGNPAELLRAELETVSELVIRSDVPVGVALSGGLDSGVITTLAARKYPGILHAFCVGYDGRPPNDEREDASYLARKLAIPFHEVEISISEMVENFPRLVRWADDPIADFAGYNYYSVMKLAREQNVPVMLQGQGGDELFWGYSWLAWAAYKTAQKKSAQESGLGYLPVLRRSFSPSNSSKGAFLLWLLKGGGLLSAVKEYWKILRSPADQIVFYDANPDFSYTQANIRSYYDPDVAELLPANNASQLFTFERPWLPEAVLLTRLICDTYLRENGIAQGDRLSMTSSVELRLPLIDYRIVEIVIGLRKTYPDYRQPAKAWFREAVKDIVPPEVLSRRKRGFAPPLKQWHQALFVAHGKSLEDGYLVQNRIIHKNAGRRLSQGEYPSSVRIPLSFKALVLECWCRELSAYD